jgi:hypothetical protein
MTDRAGSTRTAAGPRIPINDRRLDVTENRHVAKARDYLGKGDGYYERAADEMIAAQDDGMSTRQLAAALGRSQQWIATVIKWGRDHSSSQPTPFGTAGKDASRRRSEVKRAMREATPEQLHEIVAELPGETVAQLQTVAHDVAWEQADAESADRSTLTPAGVGKQRETHQRSARHRLTVLDVKVAADRSRAGLREMIELLAEVELSADEQHEVGWRVDELAQALEIVKAALGSGNWDAALAELQP